MSTRNEADEPANAGSLQTILFIRAAKAVPCADCGHRFSSEQMDFDHVRSVKQFDIGGARFRVSPTQPRAEIGKCEVLCAVCHRLRTHRRAQS